MRGGSLQDARPTPNHNDRDDELGLVKVLLVERLVEHHRGKGHIRVVQMCILRQLGVLLLVSGSVMNGPYGKGII